ncbi:glycosyltransferase family 2 protein [Persicimonas caeni]|uniref:Glycosyltransferase family 2 protein n=1 Tax=Persicimonas caeni TaxID=2292766 RepID=A0A4Y6PNN9_PERCE|nr:glycosyltransferase family 2 protein [Persicimonas caeni]QDG49931.1 glycosyltransferase family 2 protein [Persicimonas caeni]QED31152.1 glycosyltransferase family 2 protein [Persicimonas caeni]
MNDSSTATDRLVSVVVPCLNEVDNVPIMAAKLDEVLVGLCGSREHFEIIFVDDGSTDGTSQVLDELEDNHPAVAVVSFRRNFGKAAALHAGFERAQGDLVVTIDGDLQDDPKEIPSLLAKLDEGYDVVSGWKRDRKDPWTKKLPSKVFNLTLRSFSGIPLHDYNCGLKAYRREAVDELNLYGELHRYIPVLLHYEGFRVAEVPVKHHPRRFGQSKYGLERFTRGFLDMLTVILLTRYATRPLHAFGGVGLIVSAAGTGVLIYLTVLKLAYGIALGDRPLLLLGILMVLVGIQLVSTGLLGEMLARSQHARRGAYQVVERRQSPSERALQTLRLETPVALDEPSDVDRVDDEKLDPAVTSASS